MTEQKRPAVGKRQGIKKSISDRKDNIRFPLAGQDVCAPCLYFRAVVLESGRVRKLCSFTGERLTLAGNPLCEFRHVREGGLHA